MAVKVDQLFLQRESMLHSHGTSFKNDIGQYLYAFSDYKYFLKLVPLCHIIPVSLIRRSTVHSSMVSPHEHPSLASYENRQMTRHASNNVTVTDVNSGNPSKVLRPPPRVPPGTEIL